MTLLAWARPASRRGGEGGGDYEERRRTGGKHQALPEGLPEGPLSMTLISASPGGRDSSRCRNSSPHSPSLHPPSPCIPPLHPPPPCTCEVSIMTSASEVNSTPSWSRNTMSTTANTIMEMVPISTDTCGRGVWSR